jgi:hypothetical protein
MADIQPGDRVQIAEAWATGLDRPTGIVKRIFQREHGSLWAEIQFGSEIGTRTFMLRELEHV